MTYVGLENKTEGIMIYEDYRFLYCVNGCVVCDNCI